jgi:hypothetical protein
MSRHDRCKYLVCQPVRYRRKIIRSDRYCQIDGKILSTHATLDEARKASKALNPVQVVFVKRKVAPAFREWAEREQVI